MSVWLGFWGTHDELSGYPLLCAQKLFLVRLKKSYGMSDIEPGPAACKASTLPSVFHSSPDTLVVIVTTSANKYSSLNAGLNGGMDGVVTCKYKFSTAAQANLTFMLWLLAGISHCGSYDAISLFRLGTWTMVL